MNQIGIAIRQLKRRPGLPVVVILMLGLGIGATTAMFSLFHQVLIQPLAVPQPNRLVNIVRAGSGQGFSYPMLRDLEAEQPVLGGIAAHSPFTANMAYESRATSLHGTYVSGSYFTVLSLTPALGRLIDAQDVLAPEESAAVVLSHDLWRNRFGGNPEILGRTLAINGQSLTVVGVTPQGFSGTQLGRRSQVFVPLTMRWAFESLSGPAAPESRNFTWLRLIGRLAPGASIEQASLDINAVHDHIIREIEAPSRGVSDEALPEFLRARLELEPGSRGQGFIPGASESLTLLLGVTGLVLLIICVNVANLFLVRGATRSGEIAIRASMGASRGQLITQLFAEAALPAAIGGALALPIAVVMLAAVARILQGSVVEGFELEIGWTAASFAATATVVAAVVFGLAPALRTARSSGTPTLNGKAIVGHGSAQLRAGLAAAQIAFSMVLLAFAALFARSLLNVTRVNLGIDVDTVVGFSVSPQLNRYDDARTFAVQGAIEQALAAQPGVIRVAAAAAPVLADSDFYSDLTVEALDGAGQPASASFNLIGPGFFQTLGIPLLAGREFDAGDTVDSPPVAIVNERLAERFGFGNEAIGRRLSAGPDSYEIVGVAANAASDQVKGEKPPQFFVPIAGNHSFALPRSLSFYVRAGLDPNTLLTTIPRVVASVDNTLPVNDLKTLRQQAQERVFVDRLVTSLSVAFAGIATLLAAIGLYSVMAYNMTQRTRELGLRLALGAKRFDLGAMVLKQAVRTTVIGVAIGLVAAIGAGRVADALLYQLSSRDPVVLGAAAAFLVLVVLAASYWPARRASRIEPMAALRYE